MIKINNLLQIDEDLSALLKFVYLRGSRTALGQVGFTARNIHSRRIRTTITGNVGIQFIPATFELDPGQVRTILLNVSDVAFLETLPVGTTSVDFKISVNEILPPVVLLPEPVIPGIPPAPTIVLGCLDPNALNYNPSANMSDGSCTYAPQNPPKIRGCTDRRATNFNPYASEDDGSCIFPSVPGTPPPPPVYGCTDPNATNYNPLATVNTGCTYPQRTQGCTNPSALNYNPLAEIDDGSCVLAGRWVLVQIAPSYQNSTVVITQISQENTQQATPENNFTAGYYYTEYGYTETTVYGPQYEYQLEGDARTAGPRPTNPDRTIDVSRDTVGIITNRFLRPLEPPFNTCNEVGRIVSQTPSTRTGYTIVCRLVQNQVSPGGCIEDCREEFTGVYGCTNPDSLNFNPSATIDDGSCIARPADFCSTTTETATCSTLLGNSYTGTAFRTVNVLTGNCTPREVNDAWDTSGCSLIVLPPPPPPPRTTIFGCLDPRATNYNPDATASDGGCEYQSGTTEAGGEGIEGNQFLQGE